MVLPSENPVICKENPLAFPLCLFPLEYLSKPCLKDLVGLGIKSQESSFRKDLRVPVIGRCFESQDFEEKAEVPGGGG